MTFNVSTAAVMEWHRWPFKIDVMYPRVLAWRQSDQHKWIYSLFDTTGSSLCVYIYIYIYNYIYIVTCKKIRTILSLELSCENLTAILNYIIWSTVVCAKSLILKIRKTWKKKCLGWSARSTDGLAALCARTSSTVYPKKYARGFCFAVLCCGYALTDFPISIRLILHWHCCNLTIAPVPAKQPWWIWINTSCEFIMNDCITTTKQSTTKPCAYFLG